MEDTNCSIYNFIKTSCNYFNEIALHYLGTDMTYSNMFFEIDKLASGLMANGFKKGMTVSIAIPNNPQVVILLYALNKLGISVNLLHPLTPPRQALNIIKQINSSFIFLPDFRVALFEDNFKNESCKIVLVESNLYLPFIKKIYINNKFKKAIKSIKNNYLSYSKLIDYENNLFTGYLTNNPSAIILQSGGTTGVPKMIEISDKALNSQAILGKSILEKDNLVGKGMLAVLPLFHIFGLSMGIHTILANGCHSVLIPEFNVKYIVESMYKTSLNYLIGVPILYQKLVEYKKFNNIYLEKLDFAFCGGDTMPKKLKDSFDNLIANQNGKCKLLEGYGLTECMVCIVSSYTYNKEGSIGKPVKDVKIKIIDSLLKECNIGEIGEICIRAKMNMTGYLNDIEANKNTFLNIDGEIFVRTGDLGCIDKEGYVFFNERCKRVFKINGIAVYPKEIEDLAKSFKNVKDAFALGIKNEKYGETVKLFIELENKDTDNKIFIDDLKRYLQDFLLKWSIPKEICIIETMPKTLIGKTDINCLKTL